MSLSERAVKFQHSLSFRIYPENFMKIRSYVFDYASSMQKSTPKQSPDGDSKHSHTMFNCPFKSLNMFLSNIANR